jgi:hypothetical protein
VVAVWVAQLREALGGTLAREDGLEEGQAGHPGARTDDLGERAMHLFEGLVHMLQRVGGVGQQHLAMAPRAAQHTHLVRGTEGPGEPPIGVQALQPRASEPSGLWSAGDALGLAGIDQEPLQAPGLSQCKQGKPVHPS